jgi:hypothetical protein
MEERYQDYDDNALQSLLYVHRTKLQELEVQIAQLGELFAPVHMLNERNELIKKLQLVKVTQMQRLPSSRFVLIRHPQPVKPDRPHSSPFAPYRPLRASETLFGRDELLNTLSATLVDASSVNLVGERGSGKTSFVHHVVDYIASLDTSQCLLQPLAVLVNLRDNIVNAQQLYAHALKRMLNALSGKVLAQLQEYFAEVLQWSLLKQISYEQFQHALHALRSDACYVMPIVIIDDFEQLLSENCRDGFVVPEFYNSLRALLSEDLLSLLVVSRRPLAEYFDDPRYPGRLTSSFPNYCIPFILEPLEPQAIEELLLQQSPYPLQLSDVEYATTWAGKHPALLQCAGQALYEMYSNARDYPWAFKRYQELQKNISYLAR